MKIIGIGGAGSKIGTKWDEQAVAINVSDVELGKVTAGERISAVVRDSLGKLGGARMNPELGYAAYQSIRTQLSAMARGAFVFAATGGGTGCGITKGLLKDICERENPEIKDRTIFGLILPYARLEPEKFVSNTSEFLNDAVAPAIDSGSTGNIFMFSNKVKYEQRIAEDTYNGMIINSLKELFAIPDKNTDLKLLDEHIDQEDFAMYLAKPYFNHFTYFDYDPSADFGEQLKTNYNPLLLPPEQPIEAMFLLEVPRGGDPTIYYSIIEYFNAQGVKPIYSVVENPGITAAHITVALLYSRKPKELVDDFNKITEAHVQTKVSKTLAQYVPLEKLEVNMDDEAHKVKPGDMKDDIIAMLKRLNKI